MEEDSVNLDVPPSSTSSVVMLSENSVHSSVNTDEASRICPLCRSEVRLFFVHLDEKMLMCENTECEFPFGHEELKFVKVSDTLTNDEDLNMRNSCHPKSTMASLTSSSWSDKTNRFSAYDSLTDNNPTSLKSYHSLRQKDIEKAKEKEQVIQKNLEDIKELNKALFKDKGKIGRQRIQIKNQKWIKNLKNLQKFSKMQLLKPEEIRALKKEEPEIGLGELKIDIDPGNKDSISSITIEIYNEVEKEHPQESPPLPQTV